jgi:hypothetical protein
VDVWVPIEQSMLNYERATAHLDDVTLKQLKGTDHLMHAKTGETSKVYRDVLIDWLESRKFGKE